MLLLRRQLTSEFARSKPWFRVAGRAGATGTVLVRSLRSVARWPMGRVVRVLLCAVIGGVACRAAWEGAVPVVIVAGLAAFLAGLDAAEPLSQDADHPDILAMLPRHRGRLANRQIIVPVVVLALFGLVGAVAGALSGPLFGARLGDATGFLAGGAALAVLGAVTGAIGGALSVAIGPPSLATMLQTPELAFGRSMLAPGLSVLGLAVPLIWARSTAHAAATKAVTPSAVPGLFRGAMVVAVMTYAAVLFLTDGGVRPVNRV